MVITQEKFKFDFDKWSELCKNDPQAFETMREETVAQFIAGVEDERQDRLRCLQWKVDRIRARHKTPIAACVAISDMMWNSLEQLNRIYYEYDSVTALRNGKRVLTPLPNASVIAFP